jgi:FtsH-binding integral membrane protein
MTTTIELTSKKFKLIALLSGLAIFFGLVLIAIGAGITSSNVSVIGILIFGGGSISYIVNRVKIWWHHK